MGKTYTLILISSVLALMTACGKESSKKGGNANVFEDSLPLQGKYRVMIRPINTPASRITSGHAQLVVDETNFKINLAVDDAPQVKHIQTLHMGNQCPLSGDENNDGFIDAVEARKLVGDTMLILNDRLDRTLEVEGLFPSGRSYTYRKEARVEELQQDLETQGKDFKLAGKVIIIHGVASSYNLPATIASPAGQTAHESLPIACGIIERITE